MNPVTRAHLARAMLFAAALAPMSSGSLPLVGAAPLVPDDELRRWQRPGTTDAAGRIQRAAAKRRRRQRERRRVALGGLPVWLVGTPGEFDWELVAARTERQALALYVDHAGLSEWEVGDLTVKRAKWDRAVEHEPVVKVAKVLWSEMSARLPTDEPARFGWGFFYDDDPECEECNERVEAVVELATPKFVMAVCRACLAQIGGAR